MTKKSDAVTRTRKPLSDDQKEQKRLRDKARRQQGKVVETIDAGGGILVDVAEPDGGPGLEGLVAASPPVEEPKPDPRIVWPTRPQSGYCASASEWHTWQSSCGHFQIARIVARQGARSGFSCQFRAEVPNGSWELIAHEKAGPTYTRLFRTLRECLEEVERFALAKFGYGAYNLEQALSEAEKQGMADVPDTKNTESKPSRRVAEVSIVVPPYEVKENTVKISKSKAIELLKAVGVETANAKQPLKVLAKNVAYLPKLDGIGELQLDNDDLQTLLADVLRDLEEDGKKGVEVVEDVEDTPAAKGAKTQGASPAAKPSKNGNGSGKGFGSHTGQRYELFGHPVTAVIRWMGKNNFNFASARKALDEAGVACADATVKIQLRAGAKGERGDPAKLSKEDQAKLVKAKAGK